MSQGCGLHGSGDNGEILMRSLKALFCASTIALVPALSHAGGFDLTNQPIDIIFEEGNYIEGGIGLVTATVEGTNDLGDSGNVADDLTFLTFGAKTDITDYLSAAFIYDTPFLRETTYNDGLFEGTSADVEANTLTAVARLKFGENFSVYGGPRLQVSSIDLQSPFVRNPATGALTPFPGYQIDVKEYDFGFVAGAAYELPAYKVRAAVTYNSAITHDVDTQETFFGPTGFVSAPSSFELETPQSVNVDLQAPITPSTLVKASIRWANWDGVNLTPPVFNARFQRPVVEYTEDVFTYRLTVAQRINENFVGFVTGSYEDDGGEEISLFKTVDGGYSLGGGFIFENQQGLRLQLGGEYRWLKGTSGAQVPGAPFSDFDEGDALAFSLKVGYRF